MDSRNVEPFKDPKQFADNLRKLNAKEISAVSGQDLNGIISVLPNIVKTSDKLALYIKSKVLNCKKSKERAKTISEFINVLKEALINEDVFTAMTIVGALGSIEIRNLRETQSKIDQKDKDYLSGVATLFGAGKLILTIMMENQKSGIYLVPPIPPVAAMKPVLDQYNETIKHNRKNIFQNQLEVKDPYDNQNPLVKLEQSAVKEIINLLSKDQIISKIIEERKKTDDEGKVRESVEDYIHSEMKKKLDEFKVQYASQSPKPDRNKLSKINALDYEQNIKGKVVKCIDAGFSMDGAVQYLQDLCKSYKKSYSVKKDIELFEDEKITEKDIQDLYIMHKGNEKKKGKIAEKDLVLKAIVKLEGVNAVYKIAYLDKRLKGEMEDKSAEFRDDKLIKKINKYQQKLLKKEDKVKKKKEIKTAIDESPQEVESGALRKEVKNQKQPAAGKKPPLTRKPSEKPPVPPKFSSSEQGDATSSSDEVDLSGAVTFDPSDVRVYEVNDEGEEKEIIESDTAQIDDVADSSENRWAEVDEEFLGDGFDQLLEELEDEDLKSNERAHEVNDEGVERELTESDSVPDEQEKEVLDRLPKKKNWQAKKPAGTGVESTGPVIGAKGKSKVNKPETQRTSTAREMEQSRAELKGSAKSRKGKKFEEVNAKIAEFKNLLEDELGKHEKDESEDERRVILMYTAENLLNLSESVLRAKHRLKVEKVYHHVNQSSELDAVFADELDVPEKINVSLVEAESIINNALLGIKRNLSEGDFENLEVKNDQYGYPMLNVELRGIDNVNREAMSSDEPSISPSPSPSPSPSSTSSSSPSVSGEKSPDDGWGSFDSDLDRIDDLLSEIPGEESLSGQYERIDDYSDVVKLVNKFINNMYLLSHNAKNRKQSSVPDSLSFDDVLLDDINNAKKELKDVETSLDKLHPRYEYINLFIDGMLKYASSNKFSSLDGMLELQMDSIASGNFDQEFYHYFKDKNRVNINFLSQILLREFDNDFRSVTREQGEDKFLLVISNHANKLKELCPSHILPKSLHEKLDDYSDALFWDGSTVQERRQAKDDLHVITDVIKAYLRDANAKGKLSEIEFDADEAGKLNVSVEVDASYKPDDSIMLSIFEKAKERKQERIRNQPKRRQGQPQPAAGQKPPQPAQQPPQVPVAPSLAPGVGARPQQLTSNHYSREKNNQFYEKMLNRINEAVQDELDVLDQPDTDYQQIDKQSYVDGEVITYEITKDPGKILIKKDERYHLTTVEFVAEGVFKNMPEYGTDGRLVVKILEDDNSYDYVKVDDFVDRSNLVYDATINYVEGLEGPDTAEKIALVNQLNWMKQKSSKKILDEFQFNVDGIRDADTDFSKKAEKFEEELKSQLHVVANIIKPLLNSKDQKISTGDVKGVVRQAEIDYIREKGRPNVVKFGAIEGREYFSAQFTVGSATIPSSDRTGLHKVKLSNHVNDITGVVGPDNQMQIKTILGGHSSYPPIDNNDFIERRYVAYQALEEKITSVVADMISADSEIDLTKPITLPMSLVTLLTPIRGEKREDFIRGSRESEHRQLEDTSFILELMSHQDQPIRLKIGDQEVKVNVRLNHMNYSVNVSSFEQFITHDDLQDRVNAKGFHVFRDSIADHASKIDLDINAGQPLIDLVGRLNLYYVDGNSSDLLKEPLEQYKQLKQNRTLINNNAYRSLQAAMQEYGDYKKRHREALRAGDKDTLKELKRLKGEYMLRKDSLAVNLKEVHRCYKDLNEAHRQYYLQNKSKNRDLIKAIEAELKPPKKPSEEIRNALVSQLAFLKAEQIHHEELYKKPEYAYLFQSMFFMANDHLGRTIDLTCKSREDRCGFQCIMMLALDAYFEDHHKYPDFNNPGDMIQFKHLYGRKAFELSVALENTRYNSESRGLQLDSEFTLPGFNTQAGKQMAVMAKTVFSSPSIPDRVLSLFSKSRPHEWLQTPGFKGLSRQKKLAFDDRFMTPLVKREALLSYYNEHEPRSDSMKTYAEDSLTIYPKNKDGEYHSGEDNFISDYLQRNVRVAGLYHLGFSEFSVPKLSDLIGRSKQDLIVDPIIINRVKKLLDVDSDDLVKRVMGASTQAMASFATGALTEATALTISDESPYNVIIIPNESDLYQNLFCEDDEVYLHVEFDSIKLHFIEGGHLINPDDSAVYCPARMIFKLNDSAAQPAYELVSVESDKQCIIDAVHGKPVELPQLAKELMPDNVDLIERLESQQAENDQKNKVDVPELIAAPDLSKLQYFGDSAEVCKPDAPAKKTARDVAMDKAKEYLGDVGSETASLLLHAKGPKPFNDKEARLVMHTLHDPKGKKGKAEIHTASVQSYDKDRQSLRADLAVRELSSFKNLKRCKAPGLFPKVSIPNELHFEYALAIIMTAVKTDEGNDSLLSTGGSFTMNHPVKEVREAARNICQLLNLNLKCHPPIKSASPEALEFTQQKLEEWAQQNKMIKDIINDPSFTKKLGLPKPRSPRNLPGN